MMLALTATEWTAIGGVIISAASVAVAIWKYATYLNNKKDEDKGKRQDSINDANENLRVELYEQNKILRAENQAQYDLARKLATERDELEGELRRQYRYIDYMHEELRRLMLPAVFEQLPHPPTRLLLEDQS
jgi:cell division protein FtsI/penicillin-binding protein 2